MQVVKLLREPKRLALVFAVAVPMFLIYGILDARGGPHTNLFGPKVFSPTMLMHKDGVALFVADLVFDALLALANGALVAAIVGTRTSKGGRFGVAGSLVVAGATFGCPTCTVPLAGSLGASVFASTLPLGGIEFKLFAMVIVGLAFWSLERRLGRVSAEGCSVPSQGAKATAHS